MLARAQHIRRLMRPRSPARAEHDLTAPARVQQADRAGGKRRSRLRPHQLPVQPHLVPAIRAHGKPLDRDQRKVQSLHAPRALTHAKHIDLARGVGLQPDRGHPFVDIPHNRTEDETGHDATVDHRRQSFRQPAWARSGDEPHGRAATMPSRNRPSRAREPAQHSAPLTDTDARTGRIASAADMPRRSRPAAAPQVIGARVIVRSAQAYTPVFGSVSGSQRSCRRALAHVALASVRAGDRCHGEQRRAGWSV
jgi:hypothetical protein